MFHRLALSILILTVLVMASPALADEITVVSGVSASQNFQTESGIVWTNPQVGYAFYAITNDAGLYYTKTINGGTTWAAGVKVQTQADQNSRISNYGLWAGIWTPSVGVFDVDLNIYIAWLDAVDDDLYFVTLDTLDDSLGTQVSVQGLTAFTQNLNHGSQGVTITKAPGDYLYIASRSSTSISSGNRFMRSIDGGANWTTRTISITPASVQTVQGIITPCPLAGDSTDLTTNDICGWNVPNGTTTPAIWRYSDSGNTWSVLATITLDAATTTSGTCPCASALNYIRYALFGVRDAVTVSPHDFRLLRMETATDIVEQAKLFNNETLFGERITLFADRVTGFIYANSTYTDGGFTNPAFAIGEDDGTATTFSSWGFYPVDSTSLSYPNIAPHGTAGGSRYAPVWFRAAGPDLVLVDELDFPIYSGGGEDTPVEQPDELGDDISDAVCAIRFCGDSGKLLFALGTTIILSILLAIVKSPMEVAAGILSLWVGTLSITGFIPEWILYVAVLTAGVILIHMLTSRGQTAED